MNFPMTMLGQKSNLDQQISELCETLAPTASDAVPQNLKLMLGFGMSLPTAIDPAASVGVYRFALEGLPAIALKRTTEKLIRGEYDRACLGLIPTPPELAAYVRIEASAMRGDLIRLRSAKESVEEAVRFRQSRDEESKRRVRELIERSRRGYALFGE